MGAMKQPTVRQTALILGLGGIAVFVLNSILEGGTLLGALKSFAVSLGPELFGIALTVIVIDWLYEKRDQRQRLQSLVRDLGSRDNSIAVRAVSELRAETWLLNGSLTDVALAGANLRGAKLDEALLEGAQLPNAILREASLGGTCLRRANLTNTDLCDAYMENVDLQNAHLEQADLSRAVLQGANLGRANLWRANLQATHLQSCHLTDANLQNVNLENAKYLTEDQLAQAWAMRGAILPNGRRYAGQFALAGDLRDASKKGVDVDDPKAMAAFYNVSEEEYREAKLMH